jgi:hypothetical protein
MLYQAEIKTIICFTITSLEKTSLLHEAEIKTIICFTISLSERRPVGHLLLFSFTKQNCAEPENIYDIFTIM